MNKTEMRELLQEFKVDVKTETRELLQDFKVEILNETKKYVVESGERLEEKLMGVIKKLDDKIDKVESTLITAVEDSKREILAYADERYTGVLQVFNDVISDHKTTKSRVSVLEFKVGELETA